MKGRYYTYLVEEGGCTILGDALIEENAENEVVQYFHGTEMA